MALTEDDPVRYFVGFGSVSGRYGAKGQSDYCAANDMLCKLIGWYRKRHPQCAAVGIHWHAWDGAGMANQPELKEMFEAMDFRLMPPAEGIEHLINELAAGGPQSEVIITDEQHYRATYPLDVFAEPGANSPNAEISSRGDAPAEQPLIDEISEVEPGQRVAVVAKFDPQVDPFLLEHRMGSTPILPAVVAAELMVEAASLLDDRVVTGLRNVVIHSPLSFNSAEPRQVQVTVTASDAGATGRLTSNQLDRQNRLVEADRLILSADIELSDRAIELTIPHCGEPPLGWFPMQYPDEFAVQHGPRMQYLKNLFCQRDGCFGKIIAPPIAELAATRGHRGWSLSPAVLDACLVACSTYSFVMCEQRVEIPLGFARLQLVCLPREGEQCIVRAYYRESEPKISRFDFVLFGDDGRVILTADGYESIVVAGGENR
jgi:hypothetical protein